MKNASKNHLRISTPIELQFRAIPTSWAIRPARTGAGEVSKIYVPTVNQRIERKLSPVTNPDEIRRRFFRLKFDEGSIRAFLEEVGVWSTTEEPPVLGYDDRENIMQGLRLFGAFGHRALNEWAAIEDADFLRQEQKHWKSLCSKNNQGALREFFRKMPSGDIPPFIKDRFAWDSKFGNTLPVHLEWQGRHARAVVQPLTGRELMIALAWLDLVTGAEVRVCQNVNCGIEYARGGYKFCGLECERATSMRVWRSNEVRAKAIVRDHPKLSINKIQMMLSGEGLQREKSWIVKARKESRI